MRYIVQGHHEIFHWCLELEVELAKKKIQSAYPEATSAIKWLVLILGVWRVMGLGDAEHWAGQGLRGSQALSLVP